MYKSLILAGVAISVSFASLSLSAQAKMLPASLINIQDQQQQKDQRNQPDQSEAAPVTGEFATQKVLWTQSAIPIKSNCFSTTNLCPFLFEAS